MNANAIARTAFTAQPTNHADTTAANHRSNAMYINEDPLWALASKWYDVAANEAVDSGTRNGYRECANQLEDLISAVEHGKHQHTPDPLEWLDTDDPMFKGGEPCQYNCGRDDNGR